VGDHVRTLRSFAAAALVVVLIVGVGTSPVRAEAAFTPSGAVTFKVDHVKKTITVTAKLAFYNRSCNPNTACEVGAADVARIVNAIEKMWNTGLKVKCYTFHVKVDARSVGTQSEAGHDQVDIGLDYGPIPLKGYVAFVRGEVHGGKDPDPLGNTPDDRIDVVHDPAAPTTWPAQTYDQTYAHEFGHVLGLDDNYDKNNPKVPAPRASEDLMFRKQGYVTEEMAKRVVERSGQVALKDLKCGWTLSSSSPEGYTIKGQKCDDTDGEWTFQGKLVGPLNSEATYTITIPAGTLAGRFQSSTIHDTAGIVATINAKGTASVAVQPDGSVKMTLDATTATSTAVGAGTKQTVTLPIPAQQFTWQPNTGTECAISS